MDPLFYALNTYKKKKYEKTVELCTNLLDKNPYDRAAWVLKLKALTEQFYVDEVEADELGITECLFDDTKVAQTPRPETSTNNLSNINQGFSPAIRPVTQSGRPLSGFVRPGTQSGGHNNIQQALKTARTAMTARPVTSASGRFIRLGTASMLSQPTGPFVNLSRLNYNKYACDPALAKPLFEYIYYHEGDILNALELARLANDNLNGKDWWWKVQLGKCFGRLGMLRESEDEYKAALKISFLLEPLLLLGKMYLRLDQPLQAISTYEKGLEKKSKDTKLLVSTARAYEEMNMPNESTKWYKLVIAEDSISVEAIASIASNYFYSDQPEIAIRLYRRLLQMGVLNVSVFNNLGLCCFFAQHYDITLKCFEKALELGEGEELADVWYNISHVAFGIGDSLLAYQCLNLAITLDNNHSEAYNNLAVLELRHGDVDKAKSLFQTACELTTHSYEPHFNQATLFDSQGDLQSSYNSIKASVKAFPRHSDSKLLLKNLSVHFSNIV